MILQYGIYFLIIFVALIATAIFSLVSKEKALIRETVFFSLCFYFVLSVLKWYLGNPDISLFSSFWEVQVATYIHYGIPLVGIAVVGSCLLHLVLRSRAMMFIKWVDSLSIMCFSVIALLKRTVSNSYFVLTFGAIVIISLIMSFMKNDKSEYYESKDFSLFIRKNWMIALFPAFLILFYYPNELYLTNIQEFYNPYLSFVLILFTAMVALTVALLLCIGLLPKKWSSMYGCMLFGTAFCGYLQAMFLNGNLGRQVGAKMEWEASKVWINGLLWFFVFVGIIIAGYKSDKVKNAYRWGSIFITAVLSVTLLTLVIQNLSSLNREYGELTRDGDLTLAPGNNVLVFILDMYDIRFFEDVLNNESDFDDPLKDFVLYDDTIARHPFTSFSIPFLLTGTQWGEEAGDIFASYAYQGKLIPR